MTGRQTEIGTERQRDRKTDRDRDRETKRQEDRRRSGQRDKETGRQKQRQSQKQKRRSLCGWLSNTLSLSSRILSTRQTRKHPLPSTGVYISIVNRQREWEQKKEQTKKQKNKKTKKRGGGGGGGGEGATNCRGSSALSLTTISRKNMTSLTHFSATRCVKRELPCAQE